MPRNTARSTTVGMPSRKSVGGSTNGGGLLPSPLPLPSAPASAILLCCVDGMMVDCVFSRIDRLTQADIKSQRSWETVGASASLNSPGWLNYGQDGGDVFDPPASPGSIVRPSMFRMHRCGHNDDDDDVWPRRGGRRGDRRAASLRIHRIEGKYERDMGRAVHAFCFFPFPCFECGPL